MRLITFQTMPRIRFAHTYSARDYHTDQCQRKNTIEITVCTEGNLTIEQEGRCVDFKKGDVSCCFFDAPRKISTDAYHCHHTVCFTCEYEQALPAPLILRDQSSECLRQIDEIIKLNLHSPEETHKLTALFLLLVNEVERLYQHRETEKYSPYELYVKRAKRYVYDHITEPITQREIAAMLDITPEYLCTIFKKSEGRSLIRFINETKLTLIRNMMENEQTTLARAATQYGFTDPNYVSKLFKKYYNNSITDSVKAMKQTRV